MIPTLYPSLISSDLLNLAKTIEALDPFCNGYHLDVMDNHFVSNLTWGHEFINAIAVATTKKIWVHCMTQDPASLIKKLLLPSGSIVTFHIENKQDPLDLIASIREKKWLPSIAINPKTDLQALEPWLNAIDQVLLMSVEPGASGQVFIPSTIGRLHQLVKMHEATDAHCTIGVDGGVGMHNIMELIEGGAQEFAIASGIFSNGRPQENLVALRSLIATTL